MLPTSISNRNNGFVRFKRRLPPKKMIYCVKPGDNTERCVKILQHNAISFQKAGREAHRAADINQHTNKSNQQRMSTSHSRRTRESLSGCGPTKKGTRRKISRMNELRHHLIIVALGDLTVKGLRTSNYSRLYRYRVSS
ncbi:hypothetical protein EVAR_31994_1 [Eumeta japonica]|uniref:Uncharacterized protein n=1 Tax=Eumeta variegata TaxID=151549 RepID=A0A4C1VRC0_EUMVA|nr:hypothetical protein EVAR_31994_1 [Eumeta japonica]